MDVKTSTNLPLIASKPYTLALKHQKWVCKELEDLDIAGIIKRCLLSYPCPTVIVPRKCPPDLPMQERKRLCMDYRKLNTQMPVALVSKSLGEVRYVDMPKIDWMLACLCSSKYLLV